MRKHRYCRLVFACLEYPYAPARTACTDRPVWRGPACRLRHESRSAATLEVDRECRPAALHGRLACDRADRLFRRARRRGQRGVYSLDKDGNVDTVYRYRKSFDADSPVRTLNSVGLVQPDSGNAYWRIRFFGLFKADYLILEVADDYSWALIGQPDRKLGWIFGREAVMPDALYAGASRQDAWLRLRHLEAAARGPGTRASGQAGIPRVALQERRPLHPAPIARFDTPTGCRAAATRCASDKPPIPDSATCWLP